MAKLIQFRVQVKTASHETVCLVGNLPELGNWQFKNAIVLSKEPCPEEETWSAFITLNPNDTIEYRYFICVTRLVNSEAEDSMIIKRWESSVSPRALNIGSSNSTMDCFGNLGSHIPVSIDRGWLTSESAIQIQLSNEAVKIWKKKFKCKNLRIKVTPRNLHQSPTVSETQLCEESTEDVCDSNWPICEVCVLNSEEFEFKNQEQFGKLYKANEFYIYQIQLDSLHNNGYLIDVYEDVFDCPPSHIGFSFLSPNSFEHSWGSIVSPVSNNKRQPIGEIKLSYLLINPLKDPLCDFSASYSRYWNHTWQGLDVGHRGAGMSFHCAECPDVRENTLASLKRAAEHGADFVEFDVQLSKDLIPVIYHDFHCYIASRKKQPVSDHDLLEISVKDLTLEQLRMLKVYHAEEKDHKREKFLDELLEDHQPFPTLQQLFETLDPHIGFNVEIKWTMQWEDGQFELKDPIDINQFVDEILQVVFKHSGERRIVFSSFNANICTVLRLKQNKFPILFLFRGEKRTPYYMDPRSQSLDSAVAFVQSLGILGINLYSEMLLENPSIVEMCKSKGLIVFCYGSHLNDKQVIKRLKDCGVHGLIYDRIEEFQEKKESIFRLESRHMSPMITPSNSKLVMGVLSSSSAS